MGVKGKVRVRVKGSEGVRGERRKVFRLEVEI